MIRRYVQSALLIPFAVAAMALAGCGGEKSSESSGAGKSTAPTAATAEPSREIVIKANDQMQFDIKEFAVSPGETVKLTIDNIGTMPKFSMGHNVTILTRGTNVDNFAAAAANAATNDYIPPEMTARVIAHTAMTGGGEKDSVIFTAPTVRGDYDFLCTFPGHLQAGMKGVMRVQ